MKYVIVLAGSLMILTNCIAQKKTTMQVANNQLTAKEKSEGWKLLFDGKTTNGWHGYGKSSVSPDWKVEDGAIILAPDKTVENREANDIVTDEEYENYDLKLDWKISPKGNSGIIFYIHEDPAKYSQTYLTGLEMQVLDNGTSTTPGHTDARLYTHRAGDLYDLIAGKEVAKPAGEWNHVEIISKNGKLDFYMNGVHTLSATLWDEHWKQMVAISKFKDMPAFGTYKKGKISLQDHNEEVAFRNIKISKL